MSAIVPESYIKKFPMPTKNNWLDLIYLMRKMNCTDMTQLLNAINKPTKSSSELTTLKEKYKQLRYDYDDQEKSSLRLRDKNRHLQISLDALEDELEELREKKAPGSSRLKYPSERERKTPDCDPVNSLKLANYMKVNKDLKQECDRLKTNNSSLRGTVTNLQKTVSRYRRDQDDYTTGMDGPKEQSVYYCLARQKEQCERLQKSIDAQGNAYIELKDKHATACKLGREDREAYLKIETHFLELVDKYEKLKKSDKLKKAEKLEKANKLLQKEPESVSNNEEPSTDTPIENDTCVSTGKLEILQD